MDGSSGHKRHFSFFNHVQRLLGRNILVYLNCSKNNVEASVVEVECSGVKVVGQDGFRGGNGVKCWGNL